MDLENTLEQEQELLVNRLWKRMDRLEAEKRCVFCSGEVRGCGHKTHVHSRSGRVRWGEGVLRWYACGVFDQYCIFQGRDVLMFDEKENGALLIHGYKGTMLILESAMMLNKISSENWSNGPLKFFLSSWTYMYNIEKCIIIFRFLMEQRASTPFPPLTLYVQNNAGAINHTDLSLNKSLLSQGLS